MSCYQQGDVLLVPIEGIPAGAKKHPDKHVAEGEVSGHFHVATAPSATVLEASGQRFLYAPRGTKIKHQEHKPIKVPPGKYEVRIVRVYDHFATADVGPEAVSKELLSTTSTKSADSKGRITLGEKFANRTVIVKELSETEVLVELATVIPDRELWLHRNEIAMACVQRGLRQLGEGTLVNKPVDIANDRELADQLLDN
jgi:hypothetical protein